MSSQLSGKAPDRLFDGYAFDLDGTVYLGDSALPGAVQAIRRLREAGSRVVFVTNNPLATAQRYAQKLSRMGIDAGATDVITALDSLLGYLRQAHPAAQVLAIAEPLVAEVLTAAGFPVTGNPARAEVVVVSFDRTFDYVKLNAAYRAVRLHGAPLVATNPDPYCPTPDGGLPDCAAMLAAVEACTGARAEAVTGKPSQHMADVVLDRLGLPAGHAALVGDRLATDMAMAQRGGMHGILVRATTAPAPRTGAPPIAVQSNAVQRPAVQPAYVIDSLRQLIPDRASRPGSSSLALPSAVKEHD
ncbi:MAG: HAD-IIA family hydrolase [Nocardiopsaceae bacterium]|jgi:NagD protein|nr:HAD-IIA family hydrolase [Nocardiopsaceae bacterium]